MAESRDVIAGLGVDIPAPRLHPGSPENNFPEHREIPQLGCAKKRKTGTSSNQNWDAEHHFLGSPGRVQADLPLFAGFQKVKASFIICGAFDLHIKLTLPEESS